MSVDWSRPIEAVHDDGRVVPVIIMSGPDSDGYYGVTPAPDGTHNCFRADVSKWVGKYIHGDTGWRIRNVAQPAPTPDDLTKRMEAHLRNVVAKFSDVAEGRHPELDEARAIVALLPDPVDPDLLEARKLASSFSNRQDVSHNDYLSGDLDSGDEVQAVLRVIKRGRALERGEP